MKLLRRVSLFFSLLFVLSVCSPLLVSVSAIDYKTLTVSESREVFGDKLTVKYFNGSDYVETEAILNQQTVLPRRVFDPSDYTGDPDIFDLQTMWLRYDFTGTVNTNPSYIQVDFTIESTYKTSHFLTCLAIRNSTSSLVGAVSSAFSLPTWDIYDNGSRTQFFGSENDSKIYSVDFGTSSNHNWCTFIPVNISTVDSHTYVTGRACFYGVSGKSIYIRCPTIDFDGTAENGDTSGGDSGGGSSVDLTETNGLLGTINGWLSSIAGLVTGIPSAVADGVKGLFVPDDDVFSNFVGDVSNTFSDTFGDAWSADDYIGNILANAAENAVSKDSVSFPQTSISLSGSLWKFPPDGYTTVNLNPDSDFDSLFDVLASIIDIIATLAFFNMIRHRLEKEVIGGAPE